MEHEPEIRSARGDEAYIAPDVARVGSVEELTAGNAQGIDPNDVTSFVG